MSDAARKAHAGFIEEPTFSKAKTCHQWHVDPTGVKYFGCIGWVHADWRNKDRGMYNMATIADEQ
jgi:hypothetical protein